MHVVVHMVIDTYCHNLNIGFTTKWKVQGLMMSKECVQVWNTLSQMRENAKDGSQWLPSVISVWESPLGRSHKCSKSWLKRKKNTKLGPQNTIGKVLKCRCLKCPFIVPLNIKNMSYDQKKDRGSNWEFDFWPQIPWEHRSNYFWLRCAIYHWKDPFNSYKIFSLPHPSKFVLKKIWCSKFWDNKSLNFGN